MVRSLIDLFAFRSNPVSKVYQHRSRNGGILEVTCLTGSLRERTVKDTIVGELTPDPFPQLANGTGRIEHAPNGSLLTYITSADALVNKGLHHRNRAEDESHRELGSTRNSALSTARPLNSSQRWRGGVSIYILLAVVIGRLKERKAI